MKYSPVLILALFLLLGLEGCSGSANNNLPTIGFVDAFEDSTLKQAKDGFLTALAEQGFSEEKGTLRVIYRNAQGNIPTLTQIVQYMISQEVTLMATNPSLSTITALQSTSSIPVFMMVSPTPGLMDVLDAAGKSPANLYGVAEELNYIDTSFALIPRLVKPTGETLRVGLIYNQSEPQSVDAFERLQQVAAAAQVTLVARPVNATADVQLVTAALLNAGIDAFFANPDNTVFGSFETILQACQQAKVPVFTSEAGLVARGAVAAYGADIYQWGYQSGEQAAKYIQTGSLDGLSWEMVKVRKRVYNPEAAKTYGITVPANYDPISQ
ncbi:MAG: ABC transporter substrate-binding protein [Lewinellaceae bacterium]|nr:ABC transporter substrate-binding protein [Lewinellaceae bacterium]